ncbi:Mu transposase C-terminal domain-containing protein [Pseudomonas antarctica]|uniref:Mu transposase C-terminal domain-containing protein n=1 Tax=Pseudomonas antarctica TaxID=219572 RepID=UPI00345C6606
MEEISQGVRPHEKPVLDSRSLDSEISRHELANKRYTVIQDFNSGALELQQALEILSISRSQFYKLLKRSRGSLSYRAIVSDRSGRKFGANAIQNDVERLIEDMFLKHYPQARTYGAVWKACQTEGDSRQILRPSYHTVKRWIKKQPSELLYRMKHGKEAAVQRYELRPGYKITKRPLEWVQIDHTVVDMLLVDEEDRTKIIGRPYISLAICIHTRVILGFYLSFLPPSAVTVAMLLENCVLPKDELLERWGLPTYLWPMHGLPETIHTDNAKEFTSDVFVLNAKGFGITVEHRMIGKKHQGGHIESLIGKQMIHLIHQLPGSTGSNTVQRKSLRSEKTASITLTRLRQMMVYAIHAYHETKHSALSESPSQTWNKYYEKHQAYRLLAAVQHEHFKYTFYPEISDKEVTPDGIGMFRRQYSSSALKRNVRQKVLVKYDPYDISYVMVKFDDAWERIPCVRNKFNRSTDLEIYRWQRQQKGERDGTMSTAGARSAGAFHQAATEESKLTRQEKQRKKREKGIEDYKKQSAKSSSVETKSDKATESEKSHASGNPKTQPKLGKELKSNVLDVMSFLQRKEKVARDDEYPVIYDSTPIRW